MSSNHPVIRVKPREGRRARAGTPWLFSNEIEMPAKTLAPGMIVSVLGDDGRVFGTGYFNPKSLIAVRLLAASADVAIDAEFLGVKLKQALSLREAVYRAPFYRLVNAEGDGLPGLTVDRFADTVVVQITTAGMEALLEPLRAALDDALAPAQVVLRADSPARALEGLDSYVRADDGGRIAVEENGVRYFADTASGQKTGWYYDQRDNRAFVASLSRGKSVLDAYCYTGGFALAAARAGAKEAAGLDSSAPALALAEEAAAANGLSCKFVKADVFEELERLWASREQFDVVVADPPPFVKAKKDLEVGAKAYRKLARLAASVAAPGGLLLLASCSHNIPPERFALECAAGIARTGRTAKLIRQAGAGPDHPLHPMLPESAYLKALAYALD
ncbi:MAG: class I SAM-dependent rRNA methyltransferase [Alphaproteobacteria bacterium]|nr:class I SAM-dependent rRNA methyltransferase [Alphaproteobacteria bacterium]MDE2629434.1 class I SAM-dependent rRNA methyltransferase [Alphaproteobacteria bacterium]